MEQEITIDSLFFSIQQLVKWPKGEKKRKNENNNFG
jgi:hypothetical protein